MRRHLPRRFWAELILAAVAAMLLLVSVVVPDWIEEVTGFSPDGGSGALEFAIPAVLFAVAALSAFAARRDYRTAKLAL